MNSSIESGPNDVSIDNTQPSLTPKQKNYYRQLRPTIDHHFRQALSDTIDQVLASKDNSSSKRIVVGDIPAANQLITEIREALSMIEEGQISP